MADAFIGEIRAFAFQFAPYNWAYCNGSPINVSQNQILYAIIGNMYGGQPGTNYKLPNMQCYAPMGTGAPSTAVMATGFPTSPVNNGATLGSNTVTLTQAEMPSHNHGLNGANQAQNLMTTTPGPNTYISRPFGPPITGASAGVTYPSFVAEVPPDAVDMSLNMIQPTGGGGAHENRQPFLVLNFCICVADGLFPSRN